MRQITALELKRKGKQLTDSKFVSCLRDRLYPILMILTKTKVKYKIEAVNDYRPIDGKAIIFAPNHSAFPDTPIALRTSKRRSYIYTGKQHLNWIDQLFFVLNGAVWVDRKDRADMAESKNALLAYLRQGQSVLWFPEGTWNLTPSQLILPMKWGIVDVAYQARAQIIPMALEYDREKMLCRVKFGAPITGRELACKRTGIRTLRDAMATLRWELMCDHPVLSRAEIAPQQLKLEIEKAIDEYPPLDWEYERSCIYCPKDYIIPADLLKTN